MRLVALETAILAGTGSLLGMLVGPPILRALLVPSLGDESILGVPVFVHYTVDPAVAVLCGLFFFLVSLVAAIGPAIHCSRIDVNRVIQDASRSASGRTGRPWFRAIAIVEVAPTTVFAVGASLFLRSYAGLMTEELGYRTENVLRLGLFVSETDVPDPSGIARLHERVRASVLAEPGVRDVGVIWPTVPIDWAIQVSFDAPGLPPPQPGRPHEVDFFVVDDRFFGTLDIPLVAGRDFVSTEVFDSAPVAIVNRTLAARVAGGPEPERAIGLEATADGDPFRIVGIVEDVKLGGPREPMGSRHQVFRPLSQRSRRPLSFLIATERDPEAFVDPLRRRMAELAPTSAVDWVGSLDQLMISLFLRDMRFMLSIVGVFAGAGLFLSATGLFAVLTDSVVRRRGEIGLRQALGASQRQVIAAILGEALGVTVAGIALGTLIATGAKQSIASLLHGVGASDVGSHLGAYLLIAAVVMFAAMLPALRAAAIDPAGALRDG